jgi:hypothetical protein
MIPVAFLCAHLSGGWGCLPLSTMADCLDAKSHLPMAIVTEGVCEVIEVLAPANPHAPELSPLPKPRPKREEATA